MLDILSTIGWREVAFLAFVLLLSLGLGSLVGTFLKTRQPPPDGTWPHQLRDPGTYHDPAVRTVPPRADLHVVRSPVIGVDAGQRHANGLSLPVQTRLDRASAAYARRPTATGRGPVKPFGIGDDTV